ncbi:hypothetical protein D3C80_2125720 [compost metagenome]
MIAGSERMCSDSGASCPQEACTMLNESSTVTACGPQACRSISVRPRHGRIRA